MAYTEYQVEVSDHDLTQELHIIKRLNADWQEGLQRIIDAGKDGKIDGSNYNWCAYGQLHQRNGDLACTVSTKVCELLKIQNTLDDPKLSQFGGPIQTLIAWVEFKETPEDNKELEQLQRVCEQFLAQNITIVQS